LQWNLPFSKWFGKGQLNVAENCLDRHLTTARANKAAIIFEGEPGDVRTLTYRQLHREVCRFANALSSLGLVQGDRAAIYLPMVPEAAIAMLACARLGIVHTVIFGGFSSEAIKDRVNDCGARIVITADGGWRRGKIVELKSNVDRALAGTPTVEHVVVLKRTGQDIPMETGRDRWWHDLVAAQPDGHKAKGFDSEHPLFILYTSGSTGKPKGVLHTSAGYLLGVAITTYYVFDLKDNDVYFCTADVGWVTGHSYVVYGPLANGATVFMYEGAPNHPEPDRFWDLIDRHHVTIFYTAPTAIRAFMRWGDDYVKRHRLTSLRLLGTVGEPINPRRMDLVSYRDRQEALPDCRYVVADGDRRHHGDAASRYHADSSRDPARGHSSASCPGSWMTRARMFRAEAAGGCSSPILGRRCCGPSGAMTSVQETVLVRAAGLLLCRRRRAVRQGWLSLGRGPDRRRIERVRPPDRYGRSGERPGLASLRR
jgi:hypothetical protein